MMNAIPHGVSCASDDHRRSRTSGCFAKGTLVHTPDGLKPIEALKIGDQVLSAAQDGGGTPGSRRIVNTFVRQKQTVCRVTTFNQDDERMFALAATGNHLFWVDGAGWTRADALARGSVLRRAGGGAAGIVNQWPIYRTHTPGVGWVQDVPRVDGGYGSHFDYENCAVVSQPGEEFALPDAIYRSEDPYLRITVYDIEVEDDHTYFVGRNGIWVHDASRTG